MATPEEIRLLQEQNRLLREAQQTQREQAGLSNGLIDDLKEILGLRSRMSQTEEQTLKVNKDINRAINAQVSGYGTVKTLTRDVEKNQKLIAKGVNTVKGYEEEVKGLQATRLQSARDLAQQLGNQRNTVRELEDALAQGVPGSQQRLAAENARLTALNDQLNASLETLGPEAQKLFLTEEQVKALKKVTAEIRKELELMQKVEKAFGIFGSIAKALGQLPVVGQAFSGALANAQAEVAEIAKAGGQLPSAFKRATIFVGEFSKIIAAAAIGYLVQQAIKLNASFVELGRTLGISKSEIRDTNQALRDTQAASEGVFTTDSERLAVLNRISKTLGMNARILGDENVVGAARLEQSLGLAAEATDGLAAFSAISGTNVLAAADNAFDLTNQFNTANKTLINTNSVLEDVGRTSKSIGAIFAFNTDELTQATLQAKKLGLSLNDVVGIADNLLNFEDSITAELEAELLIGQDLTLERSRQLALNNDLKGLSEELTQQGITAAKFANMNRIQQQAVAKALGMSSDQLSQMLYQQELNTLGAERFDAVYGEQNRKAAEQLTIQQNLEKSLAKLAEAATPFIELIATLLSNTRVIYTTMGLLALGQIPKLISGLGKAGIAMRALGMASKMNMLSAIGTFMFQNPIGALAAAAGLAGVVALATNALKVEDGMAPSSKGPFTITDRFGATAVTTAGDNVVVSPNVNRTSGNTGTNTLPNTVQSPIQMGEVVQELKNMAGILNKINQKEGSVYIGPTKAGTAFAVGTSKLQ